MSTAEPRSWWQRHWKWAMPLGCLGLCAVAIVAVGAFAAAIVGVVFGAMKSCGAYQMALERVRSEPGVVQALGEPIRPGWYVLGSIRVNGGSGTASIRFPVSGPNDSGTVILEAVKSGGTWQISYLAVRLKASGKLIPIVEPSEQTLTRFTTADYGPSGPPPPPFSAGAQVRRNW